MQSLCAIKGVPTQLGCNETVKKKNKHQVLQWNTPPMHPPMLQLQRQVVIGFVFVTTPLQ